MLFDSLNRIMLHIQRRAAKENFNRFSRVGNNVMIGLPASVSCFRKVELWDDVVIDDGFRIIMRSDVETGRFVMKRAAHAAQGLTIVTNSHSSAPGVGVLKRDSIRLREHDEDGDVVIEEDAWIGANVTILAGVTIGRGAVVGAGSVVRKNIPPYAVAIGNPAKVVSFSFTPDQVIEHECALYEENERIPLAELQENYEAYFVRRLAKIAAFLG